MNVSIFFLTALIPLITGFIWYNPNVFGKAWMRASGLRQEDMSKGKMWLTFLLTYILSCMLCGPMMFLTIHQVSFMSVFQKTPGATDPNSPVGVYIQDFFTRYGGNFRTFKHGALHGTLAGLMFAMPVIGIIALFEKKRFSYVAIHAGYWMLTLALMGGVICQFLTLKPF